jgi:hypothetical protein
MARARISPLSLLAALLVLVVFGLALLQARAGETRSFDPASSRAGGLRGLVLWLEAMGYRVDARILPRFALPGETDLLILFPTAPITEVDTRLIHRWVVAGGTLVLIGPDFGDRALITHFGVSADPSFTLAVDLRQAQPLLPDQPARWPALEPLRGLDLTDAPAALPVLADSQGRTLVALQQVGAGTVWHLSPDLDLTNAMLRDPKLAALVPPMLRTVPPAGQVRLSTFLAPEGSTAGVASLQAWLYRTTPGRAVLLAAGLVLVFLLLQGRRLGPPLVQPAADRRRPAAEYVEAMAGLQRRARLRDAVARHYKTRLKLAAGRSLHLAASLPDADFVHRLADGDPRLSASQVETLAALLARYDSPLDEARLVRLVQETDAWLNSLPNPPVR